jgi:CDP-diacylglycerol--glycerol-3-phosphate 3-phosphatidyltransferase
VVHLKEVFDNFWVDIRKPPNIVTAVRLLFSPLPGIMLFVSTDLTTHIYAAVLFGLIASTDMLDGFLARRLDMITKLGAFMDPIVDKVLVGFILIGLAAHDSKTVILLLFFIAYYFFVASTMKKIIKLGGRIRPTVVGKVNMACQDVLMVVLILPIPEKVQIFSTAFVVGMSFLSFISYHDRYSRIKKRS